MGGKKIILLTKNNRLNKALNQAVKSKNLTCEQEIKTLSNINHIKKMINITKNTLFIRDAYSEFIKNNNGTPIAIIIDYRVDFGLSPQLDPDNMKLVRTFLVSSAILGNMTNLSYNLTNVILIGIPSDLKQFESFRKAPHLLLEKVKTGNPHLNQLLDKVIADPEKAKRLFYIDYLLMDERNDVMAPAKKLESILDKLLEVKQSIMNQEKTKHQTSLMSGRYEAAKILFKLSNIRLFLDGKVYNIENNNKFDKYKENIIYIIGYYIHSNVSEVNKKLEDFILGQLPKLKKITVDTEINISLNSHTIIDGGIAPALNLLLSTKLKDFKNVRLLTSPTNFSKMEKSPGFISLKNYIFKKL